MVLDRREPGTHASLLALHSAAPPIARKGPIAQLVRAANS